MKAKTFKVSGVLTVAAPIISEQLLDMLEAAGFIVDELHAEPCAPDFARDYNFVEPEPAKRRRK